MSISAMKQALEALEKLWDIIDDIDTYGDMAKSDDKLYRSLVERRFSEAEHIQPVSGSWREGLCQSIPCHFIKDLSCGVMAGIRMGGIFRHRKIKVNVQCGSPQSRTTRRVRA